jgi:uncharacterized membrane protein YkvA (DUF1232 family)
MEGEWIPGQPKVDAKGATGAAASASAKAGELPLPKENWKRAVIAVLAILYVLSPLDLIPDFIPVIGWLDDLGVLAWAVRYVFKK